MRLIDEIKAAAKVARDASDIMDATLFQRDCYWLLENDDIWPRIRAAIEAGEKMEHWIRRETDAPPLIEQAAARFRAAAGEGSKCRS